MQFIKMKWKGYKMRQLFRQKCKDNDQAKLANIISIISLLVAIIALLMSTIPQIVPWNNDYVAKANAGDVYSQMFLAEHYYEIGDYGEAIYWYKLASIENSKYQAYAYNNLGVIYAKGYGLSDYQIDGYRRFELALNLFQKAAEGGAVKNDNTQVLLKSNTDECFPNVNYDELIASLEDYDESYVVATEYEYRKISKGAVFWEGNKKYTGGQCVYVANEKGYTEKYYVYYVQTYKDISEIPEYKFEYLRDIG